MKFPRTTLSAQFFRLSTVSAVCGLAACGGGGSDDSGSPQPTIAQAAGALALSVDGSSGFTLPSASATEYDRHRQAATANAGTASSVGSAGNPPYTNGYYDPVELRKQWCFSAENTGTPAELADRTIVQATKLFDNMWAFGYHEVLQYAFKADNGKGFLIDTLNNTSDAQTITEPALASIGIPGNALEGAMPTHGHGDHYGGAGYLQQKYQIPVFLGSADAAVGATAGSTPGPFGAQLPFTVTSLDSANLLPQDKDFGGLPMTLLSTPGHTPGTFSGVVPAKLNGKTYQLAFWGGTAMPGTLDNAKKYLDGAERLYQLSVSKKIDGTMHTHPFVEGSWQKILAVKANPSASTNPFLIGNQLSLRSFSILRECAAAKVGQLDATSRTPVWNTTTVQVQSGKGASTLVQAVVRNPYGVLQNAQVTFNTAGVAGPSCVAFTDSKGLASCTMNVPQGVSAVTADFTQGALADGSVQLASSASVAP